MHRVSALLLFHRLLLICAFGRFSPVFGGLLNQRWGWRAIFWFLLILSLAVFVPSLLFMPETLRTLVGNGSIPAKGLNKTVSRVIRGMRGRTTEEPDEETKRHMIGNGPKKDINPVRGYRIGYQYHCL